MHRLFRFALSVGTRMFGRKLVDQRTGQVAGRVFVIVWRGKIRIIGGPVGFKPEFMPQDRLTYWMQDLGFSSHPTPDFPDEAAADRDTVPPRC